MYDQRRLTPRSAAPSPECLEECAENDGLSSLRRPDHNLTNYQFTLLLVQEVPDGTCPTTAQVLARLVREQLVQPKYCPAHQVLRELVQA